MTSKYKILFRIEVLNDYYVDEKARHLLMVPTNGTLRFMQNQQILYRQLGNKLILMTKVDDSDHPFLDLDPLATFRFYLKIDHYSFLQYSDLVYDPSTDLRYYFSNQVDNVVTSGNVVYNKTYISKKINSAYSTAKNYLPGDLVVNGSGEIFESVRKSTNQPLTDTAYWYQRTTTSTPRQYPGANDLLVMRESNFRFHLAAPAAKVAIDIQGYDLSSGLFNIPVLSTQQDFPFPQQDVMIDLSQISPGRYNIKISYNATSENREIFVDPALFDNSIIGVIEISNNRAPAFAYSFIDNTGKIKDPDTRFTIRFFNRIAYWRYLTQTASVIAVKEKNNLYTFSPDGAQRFLSSAPIALQEKPYDILIDYKRNSGSPTVQIEGMKNASYENMKKTTVAPNETFDCADIYLNY